MKILQRLRQFVKLGTQIEKGIFIKSESRETFVASFEGRRVRVYTEPLPGNSMIIYHGTPEKRAYLPPTDKGPLTEELYTFVINAIVNHFRKVGYKVEVK